MNIDTYNEHMQAITDAMREQTRRIRQLESVQIPVGGGAGNHDILSATHSDTVAAAVVRGDMMTGQGAAPTRWSRLAKGALAGSIVTCDAADVAWSSWALSGTAAQTYTFPPASATLVGGTGAAGYVAYWNGPNGITGEATFEYDAGNNRLGINKAAPAFTVDVGGKIGVSGVQTVYNAGALDVANFEGTMYFGNGGASLTHAGGGIDAFYNVCTGTGAGFSMTSGYRNNAFGHDAMYSVTTATANAAFGYRSMYPITNGYGNSAYGDLSLATLTTGFYNVAVGAQAGYQTSLGAVNQTPNTSIFIGVDTRPLADGQANQIVIGTSAVGNGTNTTTLGNTSITDCFVMGNIVVEDQHYVGRPANVRTYYDETAGVIYEELGDAAGADVWAVRSSTPAIVASVNSNGNGYFAGLLGVGVAPGTYAISATLNAVTLQRLICTTASSANSGSFTFLIEDDGAAMSSGDRLGGVIIGGARDAVSTYSSAASIEAYAAENWGAAASGSEMRLYTTPTGSTTRAERIRVTEGGNVGIGVVPTSKLHVDLGVIAASYSTDTARTARMYVASAAMTHPRGGVFSHNLKTDDTLDLTTSRGSRIVMGTDGNITFYSSDTGAGARTITQNMTIIGSTGNVGVGIAPVYRLHVSNGSPGVVTPSADVDDVVVQNSSHAGITIACPDASIGRVAFGNPSDGYAAVMQWDYTNAHLRIGTVTSSGLMSFATDNGVERVRISATGHIIINDTTDDSIVLNVVEKTTTTNAVIEVVRVEAQVSTAATGASAGFGPAIDLYGESATDGNYPQMAQIASTWTVATHATRTSNLEEYVVTSAALVQISDRTSASQKFGGIAGGNYLQIDGDGDLSFAGTARIDWTKWTANSVTLAAGSSADTVAELTIAHDAKFYHIDEAAATPGTNLIVDFVSVTAFNWVQIIAQYDGATTHSVAIQLYNWNTTAWDTFDACQSGQEEVSTASGYILEDHSFFVPSDSNYIGTGGSAGQVRVRFYHTMAGNSSHDLYIDVVALYQ